MLTETERVELHEQLRAIQWEEDARAAAVAAQRRLALDHTGGHLIDLRSEPLRMR